MMNKRTDLAVEARELWRESAGETTELPGVIAREQDENGVELTVVQILDARGEEALHKPAGNYITLDLTPVRRRLPDSFDRTAEVLSGQLRALLELEPDSSVLVVGLGNPAVTPDAVGPKTLEHLLVTRHLVARMPGQFASFRPVCALSPGVLGTTGLESVEVVRGAVAHAKPDRVIVIDALAAWNPERLCAAVQLSDTGIVPGSGVGNSREAFDRDSLGVPVVSIGVPTVVEAKTLAAGLLGRSGAQPGPAQVSSDLIVTPTDIDARLRDLTRLLGCAVNLALHESLSAEEISYYAG